MMVIVVVIVVVVTGRNSNSAIADWPTVAIQRNKASQCVVSNHKCYTPCFNKISAFIFYMLVKWSYLY